MNKTIDSSGNKTPNAIACKREALSQGQVLLAYIQKITDRGEPEVVFHVDQAMHSCIALSTIPISVDLIGRNVVLAFVAGDITRPIVMGLLVAPATKPGESEVSSAITEAPLTTQPVMDTSKAPVSYAPYTAPYKRDSDKKSGDFSIVEKKDQLEIKCGAASITLTRAGKILLRGKYISSRSSGVNRIKGGSIQLN